MLKQTMLKNPLMIFPTHESKQFTLIVFMGRFLFYWTYLLHSTLALSHGDIHDRLEAVNAQLNATPNNAELYVKRGRLYQSHEDWQKALRDYNKALEIDPNYNEVLFWKGKLSLQTEAFTQAEKLLLAYLQNSPESSTAYEALGDLYSKTNKPLAAASAYENSLNHSRKTTPDKYLQLARALVEISPIPELKIKHIIEQGIQTHGPLTTYIDFLIEFDKNNKQYASALSNLNRLPTPLVGTPKWQINKAEILLALGDKRAALNLCNAILADIKKMPPYRSQTSAITSYAKTAEAIITKINALP